MKLLVRMIRAAVAIWLRAAGVDLNKWAPGYALFHYLEGSGQPLNLNQFPLVEELARFEIVLALSKGQIRPGGRVWCAHELKLPMRAPVPDLGTLHNLNELTATIGGFIAVPVQGGYQIVDRYDWYSTNRGILVPPIIGQFIPRLPQGVKDKLNAVPAAKRGWWRIDELGLALLGRSFESRLFVSMPVGPAALDTYLSVAEKIRDTRSWSVDWETSRPQPVTEELEAVTAEAVKLCSHAELAADPDENISSYVPQHCEEPFERWTYKDGKGSYRVLIVLRNFGEWAAAVELPDPWMLTEEEEDLVSDEDVVIYENDEDDED